MNPKSNRRAFIKVGAAAGGGLLIGFNFLVSCQSDLPVSVAKALPKDWFGINAFIKIGDTGLVTIMAPNPEIGQNVKTAMPMIVAEELDVAWKDVVVEQAAFDDNLYSRQVAGGSQSIRKGWESLRKAGATARQLLVNTAAKEWGVDPADCSTSEGMILGPEGKEIDYGSVAAQAASLEPIAEVKLKDPKSFKIIGSDISNVDLDAIISGKALFGIDYKEKGMLYAVVSRPPAFGASLADYDAREVQKIQGVEKVVKFGDKVAVLATNTWAALKGQKALKINWNSPAKTINTTQYNAELENLISQNTADPKRVDGNISKAFADSDDIIDKSYKAPFLPHNCMEPMNFFADVTEDQVRLVGPIQTPEWTRSKVAKALERDEAEVSFKMTRMGGGFGRRLYGDFVIEAALISNQIKKPVQVIFSREDDMTAGTYRPASQYRFKAAIKGGQMTAYHLTGAGINMRNATRENNFPASAIAHYRVDSHNLESAITTGAWRAPVTNFLAFAEQAFLDEVAEKLGQDPLQFRLNMFQAALDNPIGELDYEPQKFIGVSQLVAEKSNWGNAASNIYQGLSVYYSHNTYVAEVAEVAIENEIPVVKRVVCAIDCGIVINPLSAKNQVEGGIIDGIGHAMYGLLTFEESKTQQSNFHQYRMIRMGETPEIDIHFVQSDHDPTGLGEPTLPPAGGAIANAIYKATGKRLYDQPFVKQYAVLG